MTTGEVNGSEIKPFRQLGEYKFYKLKNNIQVIRSDGKKANLKPETTKEMVNSWDSSNVSNRIRINSSR